MLFGMNAKQHLIFRPDVSQYQVSNFREIEKTQIEEIPNVKYMTTFEELEQNSSSEVVVISTSQTPVKELSEKLKAFNIKLWIHPNSGYDNLPQSFVEQANFPIVVGNTIRANAVYLYSVQCLLDSMGSIPFYQQWEPTRQFERKSFRKENILVIGRGHIGQKMTSFLENSELEYQLLDPFLGETKINYSKVTTVIVLASLNKTSHHLLNKEFFSKLNKSVTIINPARGKIIDEQALIEYLKSSPDSKVYLDVFEKEPCDFSKFSFHKNIHLSSHIAGVYEDIDQVIIEHELNTIKDFFELEEDKFKKKYERLLLKNKIINDILI